MKGRILGLLAVGLLTGPTISQANVLSNAGFESGVLDPWYNGEDYDSGANTEDWAVSSARAHTGTYSATDVGNLELRQDFGPVLADDIGEVSLWLFTVDHDETSVMFYYSDDTFEERELQGAAQNVWRQWDVTSGLSASKYLVGFAVNGRFDYRTYVDDVVIRLRSPTSVPEPGTLALLGLGLAGLGLSRRRKAA